MAFLWKGKVKVPYRYWGLLLASYGMITLCLYYPGLGGGFAFDDFPNIVLNEQLRHVSSWEWSAFWEASLSSDSGPLRRPLSMLSFALNHKLSGLDPFAFKLTNVLIHVIAGTGLTLLSYILYETLQNATHDKRKAFAFAAAVGGAWLLHPLQLTSVLYVVQRMNSLASLFMVWGMLFYAYGRFLAPTRNLACSAIFSTYAFFLPAALLSKENGALLPLFLALLELCFFRLRNLSAPGRMAIMALHGTFAALPLVLGSLYLLFYPEWILRSYSNRDFTLSERLLTQARVLWEYVGLTLVPDVRRMGLYHDDFTVSTDIITPWTTLAALLAWGAILFTATFRKRNAAIFFFVIAFFFVAHALESSFFGLEMMHEHRNYLASYGLIFGCFFLLFSLNSKQAGERTKLALALCVILTLAGLTAFRASLWGDDLERASFEAKHHPNSPRSNTEAAALLVALAESDPQNRETWLRNAHTLLEKAAQTDNYGVTAQLGLLAVNNKLGQAIDHSLQMRIMQRLRKTPLASATPDAVIQLVKCQSARLCNFPINELVKITNAIFGNPDLRPLDKARIYTELVQLSLSRNDPATALIYAFSAVESKPDQVQLRLNLALVLLELKRIQEAADQIKAARDLPTSPLHKSRIRMVEEILVEKSK